MRHELKAAIRRDPRTQQQIAQDAGIHEVTLSRIVGGGSCTHGTREKIADALSLPSDVLFRENNAPGDVAA